MRNNDSFSVSTAPSNFFSALFLLHSLHRHRAPGTQLAVAFLDPITSTPTHINSSPTSCSTIPRAIPIKSRGNRRAVTAASRSHMHSTPLLHSPSTSVLHTLNTLSWWLGENKYYLQVQCSLSHLQTCGEDKIWEDQLQLIQSVKSDYTKKVETGELIPTGNMSYVDFIPNKDIPKLPELVRHG